jgi:Na+/proline symporter
VTSSGSAEQIAVSSLITYDLYGTYINPRASAKQLIAVSRSVVVIYGLIMGAPEPALYMFCEAVFKTHAGMSSALPMYPKDPVEESQDHRLSHCGLAA